MKLSRRDKRALIVLAVAVPILVAVGWMPGGGGAPAVVESGGSVEQAEQRLARLRRLAAEAPQRQEQLKRLEAELSAWEAGLVRAETAQQAQAEIVNMLRELGSAQTPPLEFRSVEIGPVRALANSEQYGEALVTVAFACAIEQLVNLLAELTTLEKSVATEEIRINAADQAKKILEVRLTVAGLVPRGLVPEKRGLGAL